MAEIPVERKSGTPWLWILLALLVAALLLWWILDDGEEAQLADPANIEASEMVVTDQVPGMGADASAAGPVTQMSALIPTIAPDMVGREVQLTNVPVQEVVSDVGFWIGPNSDNRVFAVLTQEPTPGTPMEGAADVNAGAMADISGTIRTRADMERLAQGKVMDLPQGVDRFLIVESYQPKTQ